MDGQPKFCVRKGGEGLPTLRREFIRSFAHREYKDFLTRSSTTGEDPATFRSLRTILPQIKPYFSYNGPF